MLEIADSGQSLKRPPIISPSPPGAPFQSRRLQIFQTSNFSDEESLIWRLPNFFGDLGEHPREGSKSAIKTVPHALCSPSISLLGWSPLGRKGLPGAECRTGDTPGY